MSQKVYIRLTALGYAYYRETKSMLMPLDRNFEMACFIFKNQQGINPYIRTIEPDPIKSELNVVGYYRLKDKDGNTLLRIKEQLLEETFRSVSQKLAVSQQKKEESDKTSTAINYMWSKLNKGGDELSVIGGFHKGEAKLIGDTIFLYHKISNTNGMPPGIVEEIKCRDIKVEILTEDNRASVMGRVFKGAVWGLGLGLISGGLGALGAVGGVISGRTKKLVLVATLRDGRNLLIETRYEHYKSILQQNYLKP